MDEPSTSSKTSKTYKSGNVGVESTKLLQRILWKIKLDNKLSPEHVQDGGAAHRAARYTGFHLCNIIKMMNTGEPLPIENENVLIDRHAIHQELTSIYLNQNCIPTLSHLFDAVHNKLPSHVDIDKFRKILMKMGYVFYKYPNKNVLYIMEKKSVTFERYKYLQAIQKYRKDNVPIYYIGVTGINLEIIDVEKAFQTDPSKKEEYVFFAVTHNEICHVKLVSCISFAALKAWLINYVLVNLPLSSVCVLNHSRLYFEKIIDVPTLDSVKLDMVEWLEEQNITCDVDMPKSELLRLIETCTNTNENTCILDKLFVTYNHKLLWLPECINGLSISALALDLLRKKELSDCCKGVKTDVLLQNIPEEVISMFSDCVRKEEERLLEEDIKVDNVLDDLIRNVSENEDDTISPSLSDSD